MDTKDLHVSPHIVSKLVMGPEAQRSSGLITGSPTLSLKGQDDKEDLKLQDCEVEGNLLMTGPSNASSQNKKLSLESCTPPNKEEVIMGEDLASLTLKTPPGQHLEELQGKQGSGSDDDCKDKGEMCLILQF
jgi:hypothetical protein